ncbi:TAXI family TRAP transporter solute-binding subunit [Ammoniphilus sp. CFH 90114]|uniref:TAXI family TRAP transporter solute-binding subunit n=1 Tax=Ammoniphilus sp. CFH 90114 TaxID=2493665 RepID=UPI00100E556B|nr:TAXI family TRAP transporter solute-binding subunit [Ammoniphilus sp. CFH 90114]RXT02801.1 TAXI family TRAP transporter solute-binding subunit [Ammoniphilus sp. CFH 90114]
MKKWFGATAILSLSMTMLLVGCGGGGQQTQETSTQPQPAAQPTQEAEPKQEFNDQLIIATGGTAGTYYPLGGGMATIWQEKIPGLNVTAQSTGGSVENLKLINKGEVDLALVQNDIASFAMDGTEVFTEKFDKFKAVASLYPEVIQLVVSADSDIQSVTDLKGKRVSVGSAGSGNEVDARLILNESALTYDDIDEMFLSYAESADAFKNNQLDAFFVISGVPTPALQDASALKKIRLVPIEGAVAEGLKSKYPFFVDHVIPAGTYNGQDQEIKTIAVQAQLIVRDGLDEKLTQEMTKVLFENLDQLATIHAKGKEISLDKALDGLSGNVDPGTAKYYQEKGVK